MIGLLSNAAKPVVVRNESSGGDRETGGPKQKQNVKIKDRLQ